MKIEEKTLLKENFTANGEQVIFIDREHWFVLIAPIATLFLIGSLPFFASFTAFSFLDLHHFFFLASVFTMICISGIFIAKTLIDWCFHVYIITNKKILEVWYRPLFSEIMNDVLLDQVRCTEVDVQIHGILHELLDLGDITLTFDRPTHQEYFTLKNVSHPRAVALRMATMFGSSSLTGGQAWYRGKNGFRFMEDIIPTVSS